MGVKNEQIFKEQYTAQVWKTKWFLRAVYCTSLKKTKWFLKAAYCTGVKNKMIFESSILHGCEKQNGF